MAKRTRKRRKIDLGALRPDGVVAWSRPVSTQMVAVEGIYRTFVDRTLLEKIDPEQPETWPENYQAADVTRYNDAIDNAGEEAAKLAEQYDLEAHTTQIRVTLATFDVLADARYQALRVEASQYYQEHTGHDLAGVAQSDAGDPAAAERIQLLNNIMGWAAALAAVVTIEAREINILIHDGGYDDNDPEWHTIETPEEWRSVETAIQTMPPDLLADMAGEARVLNPNYFGRTPLATRPAAIPAIAQPAVNGADGEK